MKRWQIILVSVFLVIALLIGGGTMLYKYYLVPKYVEPLIEEASDALKDDTVLESLYDEAISLHEEGAITDETYSEFMRKYNTRKSTGDVEKAQQVLEEKEEQDFTPEDKTSATAKYASNRVGVQIIRTNDGDRQGKSSTRYSTERTSDRIKAEDVVEAEKTIAAAEDEELADGDPAENGTSGGSSGGENGTSGSSSTSGDTAASSGDDTEDTVKSAYATLEEHMTTKEYATFLSIMNKLDIGTLQTYAKDKEGLKEYLKSSLSESEYNSIVDLGYKYMYLFM